MRGVGADAPGPLCTERKPTEAGRQQNDVGDSSEVSLARTKKRRLYKLFLLEGLCVSECRWAGRVCVAVAMQ